MRTREFLNTTEGFTEIIESEMVFIKDWFDEIAQCKEAQKKGFQIYDDDYDNISVIQDSRQNIVSDSLKMIFAKYSAGFSMEEIKKDYLIALNEMYIVWSERTLESFCHDTTAPCYNTDEYWKILQLLSLGVLLNVSEKETIQIISIRDKVADSDFMLDYICSYFDERKLSFVQSKADNYNGLVKAIKGCTMENASSVMKDYLNRQWLKDYKRQGFLTTHNSKFNIHSGYWSFESGAIMKILNADDSLLKGQQFYPYDMVHWQ